MIPVFSAAISDSDAIFDIFKNARSEMTYLPDIHPSAETREFINNLVKSGYVLVAKENGRVVGFVHAKDGWVNHLYVDPPFQNQGVGNALLEEVKKQNPNGLNLWVFEENVNAIKFYEREGFVLVDKREKEQADNEEGLSDRKYYWKKTQ